MTGPMICPNGHAMDEGYFRCPCCGAYRPSANHPRALIKGGRVVGIKPSKLSVEMQRSLGIEPTPDVVERLVERWRWGA